eukprot:2203497-Amphidinium_carterae.1
MGEESCQHFLHLEISAWDACEAFDFLLYARDPTVSDCSFGVEHFPSTHRRAFRLGHDVALWRHVLFGMPTVRPWCCSDLFT